MKKVFFSFAIATMMASLMACGGKTEQNAEGQDSTAVEAEAEEAAEPAANIVDNDAASVTLPEGWIIDTSTAKNFRVVLPKEGDTAETWKKNGAQASIEFNVLSMSNVENWLNGREVNAKEDFTIGGKTFKVYADARANNLSLYLLSDTENGLYKFETSEKDFDEMPAIKQVLEAVSFK